MMTTAGSSWTRLLKPAGAGIGGGMREPYRRFGHWLDTDEAMTEVLFDIGRDLLTTGSEFHDHLVVTGPFHEHFGSGDTS